MPSTRFNPSDIIAQIDFNKINKHPNILIAASFWEEERYQAAKICYQFMRKIDDLVDDRKADLESLSDCEKQIYTDQVNEWITCLNGKALENPFFDKVAQTVNDYQIPIHLFHIFAKSMIYDINHAGFDTFEDFISYAEGASVAPAAVFVHLCCLNREIEEYVYPRMDLMEIARPCAIFSYLVHIIRDFQIDQQNNLNYFANDILQKYDLKPEDLKRMANGSPIDENFRKVIALYKEYADQYRLETEKAIEKLSPYLSERYLLSLKIIYNLYLQVYNRIDIKNGTFTAQELNPTHQEIKINVLKIIEECS